MSLIYWCTFGCCVFIAREYIQDLKWMFISYGIYETSCVFYIPDPLARGYKIRNEFHKYHMKWKFMSDSFYHMLNSQNTRKTQFYRVLLPILLRKTRQHRGVTYDVIDELRRLSLSKCFPPLCHKLIYHMILHLWSEISLFHKLINDIAPGSILIDREVVVRLWRHW